MPSASGSSPPFRVRQGIAKTSPTSNQPGASDHGTAPAKTTDRARSWSRTSRSRRPPRRAVADQQQQRVGHRAQNVWHRLDQRVLPLRSTNRDTDTRTGRSGAMPSRFRMVAPPTPAGTPGCRHQGPTGPSAQPRRRTVPWRCDGGRTRRHRSARRSRCRYAPGRVERQALSPTTSRGRGSAPRRAEHRPGGAGRPTDPGGRRPRRAPSRSSPRAARPQSDARPQVSATASTSGRAQPKRGAGRRTRGHRAWRRCRRPPRQPAAGRPARTRRTRSRPVGSGSRW